MHKKIPGPSVYFVLACKIPRGETDTRMGGSVLSDQDNAISTIACQDQGGGGGGGKSTCQH